MKADELRSEKLRAAWSTRRRTDAGPSCPPPDDLWLAARGELEPASIRTLVEHVASCGSCTEAWLLARELGEVDRPAELSQPSHFRSQWGRLAAVLALLMLGAGVAWRLAVAPEPTPVYRDADAAAIEAVSPETLSRDEPVLRWKEEVGAIEYRLLVTNEDGSQVLVDERDLDSHEYRLDLAALGPERALVWQVEAVMSDGRIHRSPSYRVRIE